MAEKLKKVIKNKGEYTNVVYEDNSPRTRQSKWDAEKKSPLQENKDALLDRIGLVVV